MKNSRHDAFISLIGIRWENAFMIHFLLNLTKLALRGNYKRKGNRFKWSNDMAFVKSERQAAKQYGIPYKRALTQASED